MTPSSPNDDYLWDRSGEVDPEVAELERLLAPMRWRERAFAAGHGTPRDSAASPPRRRPRPGRVAMALAATLAALAIGIAAWWQYRQHWPAQQPWQVVRADGEVRIDGQTSGADARLAPGAVLETGAGHVRLRAARIGEVVVGAGSRFRILATGSGRHRTQLEHGRLWARIWAPPGAFGVATPAGEVFDLGCEFVVDAREDGSGLLAVRSGWVQVDNGWHEVLVPQGARVAFAAGGRPGTPYDAGATAAFLAALRAIDALPADRAPDAGLVQRLVAHARPGDAISLLSLLRARPALAQGPVYDRLAQWMPQHARVSRAAIREQGPHALSPWWDALPYPKVKRWWTKWPDALPARGDAGALLETEAG